MGANSALTLNSAVSYPISPIKIHQFQPSFRYTNSSNSRYCNMLNLIRCSSAKPTEALRTCKNCKAQFDPSVNHPRSCRYHTAHFGAGLFTFGMWRGMMGFRLLVNHYDHIRGETKRKFESVHSGGTMSTPDAGKISQYWHCCGSEDPFDPGCTAAPHSSYDD